MGNRRWVPLKDGLYCGEALAVAYKGTDIGIKIDDEYPMRGKDWVNNYEWLSDAHVSGKGLDANEELKTIRLCRATPDEGIPDAIAETMRDMAGDWLQTYDEGDEEYDRANALLAWLDQQQKGSGEDGDCA